MIATAENLDLTRKALMVILAPVAHNGGTELAFRNVAAQPQTCGFFVRKIPAHHVMTDWAEHSQEWPGATPVRQLRSVCHQMIGVVWRQVYNLIRVAIMNTSIPSTAHNSEQITHIQFKQLPDYYPRDNDSNFFVVICETDALRPVAYHGQGLLMRKNHIAEVGDAIIKGDIEHPYLELCTDPGVYPAVAVASKNSLMGIDADGKQYRVGFRPKFQA
jgi:hypothetical protein